MTTSCDKARMNSAEIAQVMAAMLHVPYGDESRYSDALDFAVALQDALFERIAAIEARRKKAPDYGRRMHSARALRNVDPFGGFENIQNRSGAVYSLLQRMRLERDAARAERDKALRTVARLAMQGVRIPQGE